MFWGSGVVVHVHWRRCRPGCAKALDPIPRTAGCFKRGTRYPQAKLVLTYLLRC